MASASRLLVAVQVVSVVSGSIAVSTFLAQLVPWWSLPAPMTALIVTILAIAGLITALAFAGPWRTHVLGPLTVVAAVTSVAMLVDVMTGSTLQVNAVSGYEPVTGGRFYGFSNIAFAIYATGTILGLAGVAQWLMGRGASRFVTMLVCVLYGGLAVFADGWPSWGADFGGVPAFVVGLAVFLILLSGRRVSVLKLLLVGLAGGALISAIALFDWLRPATQRTHLGTFVQQVIDGQALTVVVRKFTAMVGRHRRQLVTDAPLPGRPGLPLPGAQQALPLGRIGSRPDLRARPRTPRRPDRRPHLRLHRLPDERLGHRHPVHGAHGRGAPDSGRVRTRPAARQVHTTSAAVSARSAHGANSPRTTVLSHSSSGGCPATRAGR